MIRPAHLARGHKADKNQNEKWLGYRKRVKKQVHERSLCV
jgi:hypothetical protein